MDLLPELWMLAMETNKSVVLHCRDSGTSEAAKHLLQAIMLDMEGHLYHRHCYTGSVNESEEWLESAPSVIFGIYITKTFYGKACLGCRPFRPPCANGIGDR